MNLYFVKYANDDYGVFIFTKSANKARSMATHYFINEEEEDYVNTKAYLKAKNVDIGHECVIEDEYDKEYELVLKCGCRYLSEEEI